MFGLLLQVGQWDCKDRIKLLEDEYSFRCQCRACLKANFSDLVLHAFHCTKPNCSGIVLDSGVLNCEKHKIEQLYDIVGTSNWEPHFQVIYVRALFYFDCKKTSDDHDMDHRSCVDLDSLHGSHFLYFFQRS